MSSSQHCEDDITQCDPCDAGQVAVIIPFLDGGMKAKHDRVALQHTAHWWLCGSVEEYVFPTSASGLVFFS